MGPSTWCQWGHLLNQMDYLNISKAARYPFEPFSCTSNSLQSFELSTSQCFFFLFKWCKILTSKNKKEYSVTNSCQIWPNFITAYLTDFFRVLTKIDTINDKSFLGWLPPGAISQNWKKNPLQLALKLGGIFKLIFLATYEVTISILVWLESPFRSI